VGALFLKAHVESRSRSAETAWHWRCTLKGLELPGYEPRRLQTMALGLAVSPARLRPCSRDFAPALNEAPILRRVDATCSRRTLAEVFWSPIQRISPRLLDSRIVCKFLRKCSSILWRGAEL